MSCELNGAGGGLDWLTKVGGGVKGFFSLDEVKSRWACAGGGACEFRDERVSWDVNGDGRWRWVVAGVAAVARKSAAVWLR